MSVKLDLKQVKVGLEPQFLRSNMGLEPSSVQTRSQPVVGLKIHVIPGGEYLGRQRWYYSLDATRAW
jgi:hypothetical protein